VGTLALVSLHSRFAAPRRARLGLEKEWHYQARETEECAGCGERVKPGIACANRATRFSIATRRWRWTDSGAA